MVTLQTKQISIQGHLGSLSAKSACGALSHAGLHGMGASSRRAVQVVGRVDAHMVWRGVSLIYVAYQELSQTVYLS